MDQRRNSNDRVNSPNRDTNISNYGEDYSRLEGGEYSSRETTRADMGGYGGARNGNQESTYGNTNVNSRPHSGGPGTFSGTSYSTSNRERYNTSQYGVDGFRGPRDGSSMDRGYTNGSYGDFHEPGVWESVKNFFGMGPKDYKRSDARIQEDVNEALYVHPGVDARDIEVSVSDGVVTLTGTVTERRVKRLAEDAAHDCRGVIDVRNEVRVNPVSTSYDSSSKGTSASGTDTKTKGHSSLQ